MFSIPKIIMHIQQVFRRPLDDCICLLLPRLTYVSGLTIFVNSFQTKYVTTMVAETASVFSLVADQASIFFFPKV